MELLRLNGVDMSGGTIPTALATLTLLAELKLVSSNLTGSIPSEIGLLTDLLSVDLSVRVCMISVSTDLTIVRR